MPEAARTLVKSPPELWAEVSDPTALARHLGAFGDIRIIRLDPEVTVAWEGDRASGTVALEPTGWGTKVTVAAEPTAPGEPDVPAERATAQPECKPAPDPVPERRPGLLARLLGRRAKAPVVEEPVRAIEPPPAASAEGPLPAEETGGADPAEVLEGMLASLGAAHHRPFSRG